MCFKCPFRRHWNEILRRIFTNNDSHHIRIFFFIFALQTKMTLTFRKSKFLVILKTCFKDQRIKIETHVESVHWWHFRHFDINTRDF